MFECLSQTIISCGYSLHNSISAENTPTIYNFCFKTVLRSAAGGKTLFTIDGFTHDHHKPALIININKSMCIVFVVRRLSILLHVNVFSSLSVYTSTRHFTFDYRNVWTIDIEQVSLTFSFKL